MYVLLFFLNTYCPKFFNVLLYASCSTIVQFLLQRLKWFFFAIYVSMVHDMSKENVYLFALRLFWWIKSFFNPFAPWPPLGGWNYQPKFGQQYLENGKNKHCLYKMIFKEYSISFLMVCRLIDFALMVLKLLMFQVCAIIGISKIEFFNFCCTERINI